MSTRELDRPLEASALREIEGVLRGRLRAYGLSMRFIDRTVEDAAQMAWEEYLRARAKGEQIENPTGYLVRRGFYRAIDELRREGRRGDGGLLEIFDGRREAEPPAEEAAIDGVQAEQLREAVGQLSPEEQQLVVLHYFEGQTEKASAAALFCSERTYRRRLKHTLKKLGRILGAPVPESESELAIEIGVLVWVALRGAKVALSRGPLDQIVGALDGMRDGAAWLGERLRDLAGRFIGTGASERVAAVAAGPAGKVAGACVAACVIAVGGVEVASIGGSHPAGHRNEPRSAPATHRATQSEPPPVVSAPPVPVPQPSATPASRGDQSFSRNHSSGSSGETEKEAAAQEAVESQSLESQVSEEAPATSVPTESASSSPPAPSQSPTEVAAEQFGP